MVIKDSEDIEEAPAESLGSLLANEPGIDWRTRGNYGGATEEITFGNFAIGLNFSATYN